MGSFLLGDYTGAGRLNTFPPDGKMGAETDKLPEDIIHFRFDNVKFYFIRK